MNTATVCVNVGFHFWIPTLGLVSEVHTCIQHLFDGDLSHIVPLWLIHLFVSNREVTPSTRKNEKCVVYYGEVSNKLDASRQELSAAAWQASTQAARPCWELQIGDTKLALLLCFLKSSQASSRLYSA